MDEADELEELVEKQHEAAYRAAHAELKLKALASDTYIHVQMDIRGVSQALVELAVDTLNFLLSSQGAEITSVVKEVKANDVQADA